MKHRRTIHVMLVAVAMVAFVPCGIAATAQQQKPQGPQNALQGFSQNRDQPVRIQAASLEVREKDKMATFTGEVHVTNGDTEMRCRSLVVFYEEDNGNNKTQNLKAADPGPGGEKQIKRIEAKGDVIVNQKDQIATGDSAIFNLRENVVVLNGNVVVTKGADVLKGQRLIVDLTSGVSKMEGGRVDAFIDTRGKSLSAAPGAPGVPGAPGAPAAQAAPVPLGPTR
jgi:lipopolysaccharide export system protein LptA